MHIDHACYRWRKKTTNSTKCAATYIPSWKDLQPELRGQNGSGWHSLSVVDLDASLLVLFQMYQNAIVLVDTMSQKYKYNYVFVPRDDRICFLLSLPLCSSFLWWLQAKMLQSSKLCSLKTTCLYSVPIGNGNILVVSRCKKNVLTEWARETVWCCQRR